MGFELLIEKGKSVFPHYQGMLHEKQEAIFPLYQGILHYTNVPCVKFQVGGKVLIQEAPPSCMSLLS